MISIYYKYFLLSMTDLESVCFYEDPATLTIGRGISLKCFCGPARVATLTQMEIFL